jgi:hypothetical protein
MVANVNVLLDDGVFFIFAVSFVDGGFNFNTGFMHRPVEASEPFGKPPVTWSEFSDLGTWVETVKYAARTQTPVLISYDTGLQFTYTPSFPSPTYTLAQLYAISPAGS